jgi:hypothetical protein
MRTDKKYIGQNNLAANIHFAAKLFCMGGCKLFKSVKKTGLKFA